MNHKIVAALLVSGALTVLPACERKIPTDSAEATSARPKQESAARNQTATDSKADLVQIQGGRFMMGDKDEVDATPHEVVVSSFYMDKHLVTQEQYQKVMGTNPSRWKGDKNPVEQVRWSDAVKFCNKRSELEGLQPCYDLENLEVQLRRKRIPAAHGSGVGICLPGRNHDRLFLRR